MRAPRAAQAAKKKLPTLSSNVLERPPILSRSGAEPSGEPGKVACNCFIKCAGWPSKLNKEEEGILEKLRPNRYGDMRRFPPREQCFLGSANCLCTPSPSHTARCSIFRQRCCLRTFLRKNLHCAMRQLRPAIPTPLVLFLLCSH